MLGTWHSHAEGVVRRVAEHPGEFRLTALWDPEVAKDRAARWKQWIPDLRFLDRPEDVLSQPLDGVVVEGRVHQNLRWARLALEAGYPVLLEKPAGDRLEEHRRLVELARAKHLHLQMSYLFRYMTAVLEMLARAKRGELGRIYQFRARLPKDLPSYGRFVEELKPYRGGMFFEMAGHVIDMCVAILGRPKGVSSFLAHHHQGGPQDYLDNGVAVLEYEHAFGIIEVPALEVAPASRRIEVYGTEGAIAIPHLGSGHLENPNVQPIEFYRAGMERWQRLDLPAATLQIADLREFAACAARKKEPDYSLDHDLAVEEILLKASRMS